MPSALAHLECSRCKKIHTHERLQNLCHACGMPLLARYDLRAAAKSLTREALATRPATMWRYAEVLPDGERASLGEGMTPTVHAGRLGRRLGIENLYIKDEGLNPTGSFKARGLSAAVTRARALGARKLAIPTAGNAGGALAAYAAQAGLRSVIVMPADTPIANVVECRAFGADVRLLDGLISDCGKYVAEHKDREGWFEVSTLKEPYRIEGKKTMAYELWEQFDGKLPEVIIYPTGGGVGLIGMWKAFEEMEAMGWLGHRRPRMVSVQAAGCAPIVAAFEKGGEGSEFWEHAATIASGLRVPKALGDFLILTYLRASCGAAIISTDDEMLAAGRELAALEGIFAAPEGAATVVAAGKLAANAWIQPGESVVLFNTGAGYKYSEAWARAL
ncbi:MAG TPA: threonine synthase, partial [Candidatus Acidoferrales bacterium]|nr:threonine synthase [Candidatus Acidoferrales bacterium]